MGLSINHAGQIAARIGGGIGQPSATVYSTRAGLNDGSLHVATLTRAGSQMALFVDDDAANRRSNASTRARARLTLSIGRLQTGKLPFNNDIAEVRIYIGALSETEVRSLVANIRDDYDNEPPKAVNDRYDVNEVVLAWVLLYQ